MHVLPLLLALIAQRPDSFTANVREYIAVDTSLLALTHVLLVDGTGAAPKQDQTIVIRAGRIVATGASASVLVPAGAKTMDMTGSTVIPGIIGMHDHLFYTAAGGRAVQMSYTGPRLYLGSGVTTIRTTGSRAPYAEINLKDVIDHGYVPGPRIHLTAPYITGAEGGGAMAILNSPDAARRFVDYWASEGATWIKAYTDIRRAELGAAIQEAHRRGIKVTGHLCSVSFQEAVSLGIDNLEHGMLTASDFTTGKQADVCPVNLMSQVSASDPKGQAGQATIRSLVDHHVPMTSTLAVYEPFVAGRPTKDDRTLQAMDPEVRDAYMKQRTTIDTSSQGGWVSLAAFKSAMAFERAFVDAGGLMAAGVDPTGIGGALAGFGDQRNYELFIEAGFSPAVAIQIMTLNGAKILGVAQQLGTVQAGKLADIVVLRGDLTADPSVIRNPTLVFKDGVGYDSAKLLASVQGRVGVN